MSKLAFIDTETTSLRPDRRVWEVALIVRDTDGNQQEHLWTVQLGDLDLGNADPFALQVGRFYERHPQVGCGPGPARSEPHVMWHVERLTRGAHLVGAVPNFDADVLGTRMRAHGILPSWHYHLIDVEALAVGYLWGTNGWRSPNTDTGSAFRELMQLPWNSDDLSKLCNVEPAPETERHTALGDARWAMRLYDAVTGAVDA